METAVRFAVDLSVISDRLKWSHAVPQSTQCPPAIWRHWPKSTVTVRSQLLYWEGLREASCTLLQVITATAQDKSQKSVTVLSRLCGCFVSATQAYLLLMKKQRGGHGDKGKAGQRFCNFKSLKLIQTVGRNTLLLTYYHVNINNTWTVLVVFTRRVPTDERVLQTS